MLKYVLSTGSVLIGKRIIEHFPLFVVHVYPGWINEGLSNPTKWRKCDIQWHCRRCIWYWERVAVVYVQSYSYSSPTNILATWKVHQVAFFAHLTNLQTFLKTSHIFIVFIRPWDVHRPAYVIVEECKYPSGKCQTGTETISNLQFDSNVDIASRKTQQE